MERLLRWCTDNPWRVVLVALVVLVLGALGWRNIPLVYLYDPSPPQLIVVVRYPGAPADLVSANVTARLESEIRGVPGVRRVVARAVDGSASLAIDFDRQMRFADGERQVRERVGRLRAQLPRETREPEIFQVGGGDDQAVLEVAVGSDRHDRAELTEWIGTVARRRIEAVPGVGDLSIAGDAPRQLEIAFDPRAAAALGVSIDDVTTAIRRENVDARTGYLQSTAHQRILRVSGRLDSAAAFERIAVRRAGPHIVRLGEVATVREGAGEASSLVRFDGRDSVSIKVFPLAGANVAQVAARLRAALARLQSEAPVGVSVAMVVDNSEYAQASLDAVTRALLEGAALTVLLVALCLRSARSAFITSLTLPLSVLLTVLCLWALGHSLNLFTLLALTLSIGVLIDDAIVVRENIVRHLDAGRPVREAALAGTLQIAQAVASTTLVIVAVFLPLMLAGGPLGPFIRQFALTVAIAVSVSLLVSFTVDPALSVLLRSRSGPAPEPGVLPPADGSRAARLSEAVHTGRWLGTVLRHRRLVAVAAAALAGLGTWLATQLPTELMPEFDEGIATLNVELPAGSRPDYLRAKAQQVEAAVREFPEVTHLLVGIGTPRSKSVLTLFIRLTPSDQRQRGFRDVEAALRERLARIAGVSTSPTSRPVGILLSGPDDAQLESVRRALVARLAGVKGLTDIVSNDIEEGQAVVLELHRDRLADVGVAPDQVADLVSAFLSGAPISTWHAPNGRQYDIALRFPASLRGDADMLETLELVSHGRANGPAATPLRAVADIRIGDRPRVIERVDGMRLRRIQAAVAGRPLGDVVADVKKALAGVSIPRGVEVAYGGRVRELEASQDDFATATALALLSVFCVLAIFFGGAWLPLVIMASIPLGCIGALAWLWLSGGSLNVFSGVGLLLVAGLVAKNGILLVDFARRAERDDGLSRADAIKAAVAQRTRPILMTSGAMLMGMLPMALGVGHGGEQLSMMGQAIVSGVIASTALSLVVVPALYVLVPVGTDRPRRLGAIGLPAFARWRRRTAGAEEANG